MHPRIVMTAVQGKKQIQQVPLCQITIAMSQHVNAIDEVAHVAHRTAVLLALDVSFNLCLIKPTQREC